jgi:nucleosome binding factor SPN SPT16 subunit
VAARSWLTSMKIKYYENRLNLVWKPILRTILDDPDKFLEDGGWEFLNADASDEEAGSDDESEAYQPSDEEAASESSEVRPPPAPPPSLSCEKRESRWGREGPAARSGRVG